MLGRNAVFALGLGALFLACTGTPDRVPPTPASTGSAVVPSDATSDHGDAGSAAGPTERCAHDDPSACLELAAEAVSGTAEWNPSRAAELRGRWCDRGVGQACFDLASQYEWRGRDTIADDPARREQLLQRACDAGYAMACVYEGDYRRAFDLDMTACHAGDGTGCFAAHSIFQNRNLDHDVDASVWPHLRTTLEPACARGAVEACSTLERLADEGLGEPQNLTRALRFRERECELHDPLSCASLADGINDPVQARVWLGKACDLGDADACERLAGKSDAVRAFAFHLRACDLGEPNACATVIGVYDRGGHGVAADPSAARRLRERQCTRGNAPDCIDAARHAEHAGDRDGALEQWAHACVVGDIATGCRSEVELLNAQCTGGSRSACETRDQMLARLPPAHRDLAAFACCRGLSGVGTSPEAPLLALADALRRKDRAVITGLIHPSLGLAVRLGIHGATGASEQRFTLWRRRFDLAKLATAVQFDANHLICPDTYASDDEAWCMVQEGGFVGRYRLTLDNGHAYVMEIDEESH